MNVGEATRLYQEHLEAARQARGVCPFEVQEDAERLRDEAGEHLLIAWLDAMVQDD